MVIDLSVAFTWGGAASSPVRSFGVILPSPLLGKTFSEHFNVDTYLMYYISKVKMEWLGESLPPARLTRQQDELFTVFYLIHRPVNRAQEMHHSSQ
jgi:hypothetical protein